MVTSFPTYHHQWFTKGLRCETSFCGSWWHRGNQTGVTWVKVSYQSLTHHSFP